MFCDIERASASDATPVEVPASIKNASQKKYPILPWNRCMRTFLHHTATDYVQQHAAAIQKRHPAPKDTGSVPAQNEDVQTNLAIINRIASGKAQSAL